MTYNERKLARQAYNHRIADQTRSLKMQDRPDAAASGSAMAPVPMSNNSSGNSLGQETAAIWRLTKLFPRSSDPYNFLPKANILQLITLPFCASS
ncbi:MAG: hypothetical protein ACLP4V_18950 [Methylocella sp.]